MKSIIYSCLVLFGLLYSVQSFATETEPNDTKAQANTLTLNGSNTGEINPATTDVDWWKVTTNKDGQLSASITISNGLYCWIAMYDKDGVTLVPGTATANSNGTATVTVDGLAAGTYYLKVYPYFSDQMPAYTISNTLTNAAFTNDAESNDTKTTALTLAQNGTTHGHIDYYFNNKRDSADWYKITTSGDGYLRLILSSSNGQYIWAYLYDNDGTTQLNANNTNGTININTDGLAAGTYYVRVNTYFNNGFAPYTLTDSLFNVPVANDVEPNGSRATALTLPLNSSVTGHTDYYYNLQRDLEDWYKVTTNGDGRLRLRLTSSNGQYIWAYLYDNDGTTQLNAQNTNGTIDINTDGLAAGTYYVKVNTYYGDGFAGYTLADSLFKAPVANDAEPNGTKAQAVTLTVGSTVTGHTGYYYNLQRDDQDWYKLVTSKDGRINLTISSSNGQYVWVYLYDNDGTTLLNSQNTNGSTTINTDGLSAGTYYVEVNTYYNPGFAPYTLTNSLDQYTNNSDGISNDHAKKAATLNANQATPGHVGFRNNGGARDGIDWWKINYTGSSGNLTVTLSWETWKNGSSPYVWMTIYSDTLAAPIYNQNSNGGTLTANLTALPQQYYYVAVYPYYGDQWAAYSLNPTWTQTNKAQIALQTATTGTDCSNASLSYKCTKSHSPYSVRLYRFGVQYGNPITVNNSNAFSITALPPGSYYATVYGDGATGNAKGTSVTSVLVPTPTNPNTTKIKATKATLNWDSLACIKYDSIYYRVQGNLTWTKIKTPTNHGSITITGLTASTTYEWQVAHVDTGNNQTARGNYTSIVTFTTSAVKMDAADEGTLSLDVYPNPATDNLTIDFNTNVEGKTLLRLIDVSGRIVMVKETQAVEGANNQTLDISSIPAGIYTLQMVLADGSIKNQKVVKVRK